MMTIATHNSPSAAVSLDNVTDLDAAMRVCEQLALSDIVPKSLRGKSANVFVVYITGRELGLSFAQSLRSIYVPGGGQPQLRGSLLLAKIREAGHKYRWEYSDDGDTCTFYITRGDEPDVEYSESFSLADALTAGLVRQAATGAIVALSSDSRPLPWQQYRHDMLFWRAVARCANRVVPELILGFEIAGAGEVQRDTVTPQPAGVTPSPVEAGSPASAAGGGEDQAAELAGLDAQGAGAATPAQGAPPAGEPVSTLPPADPPQAAAASGPATATAPAGTAQTATAGDSPVPGGAEPRASKQALKKLCDAFTALGWTMTEHQAEIMNACTVLCQRPIYAPARLSNPEATRLVTELGKIIRTNKVDHRLVALSDAIDGWEHDWEEADPDAYETYKGAS